MLAQYVSELRWLGKLAYPDMATVAREDFLKDLFLRGQGSDTFKEQTLTPQMEAIQLAERHESGMRDLAQGRHTTKLKVRFSSPTPPAAPPATPDIMAQAPSREPEHTTYTVGQMSFCDILKLMAITTQQGGEGGRHPGDWHAYRRGTSLPVHPP